MRHAGGLFDTMLARLYTLHSAVTVDEKVEDYAVSCQRRTFEAQTSLGGNRRGTETFQHNRNVLDLRSGASNANWGIRRWR